MALAVDHADMPAADDLLAESRYPDVLNAPMGGF
jgi:hypothetical protein